MQINLHFSKNGSPVHLQGTKIDAKSGSRSLNLKYPALQLAEIRRKLSFGLSTDGLVDDSHCIF